MSEHIRNRMFWINIIIGVLLIVYIGVRTEITAIGQERQAAEAVQFSAHTQQCLHELIDALDARAVITQESDRLNNDQHQVLRDLVTSLAQTPVEGWGAVISEFLPAITEAQQRQENLLLARSEHPLPDPTCPVVQDR